jgi:predicted Zn-dependent peptidase
MAEIRMTVAALLIAAGAGCSGSAARVARPDTLPGVLSAESRAVQQIQIISERLASGYRVVIARVSPVTPLEPRVFIGCYVLHGSLEERELGWAHLMEHVAANNRSAIAGPLRPEGVDPINSNALARPYYTSFVSVVPPAMLPSVLHSRMARAGRTGDDPKVFADEVARVIAELERDRAGRYPAYKALVALALGQSPLLADEIASVRRADQQSLAAAMAPIYRPDNAVLVIAGGG